MHAHLANLERVGLLRRDPTKPRAIELLVDRAKRAMRGPGLPLVGHVAAGEPILAEENIEEYVQLPPAIGGEQGDYILQVKGDSMRDAGILEGDYVVVSEADDADNGQIVVALIEDEATVKRFYREKDRVRLQPANKAYKPIRTRDAKSARPGRRRLQEGLRMGALATRERAIAERPQADPHASRLFEPRGATLEDSILAVWQELVAEGRADCPVCGGSISADGGCAGCGSELR